MKSPKLIVIVTRLFHQICVFATRESICKRENSYAKIHNLENLFPYLSFLRRAWPFFYCPRIVEDYPKSSLWTAKIQIKKTVESQRVFLSVPMWHIRMLRSNWTRRHFCHMCAPRGIPLPWWHRKALTQRLPFLNVIGEKDQVYACWKWFPWALEIFVSISWYPRRRK